MQDRRNGTTVEVVLEMNQQIQRGEEARWRDLGLGSRMRDWGRVLHLEKSKRSNEVRYEQGESRFGLSGFVFSAFA